MEESTFAPVLLHRTPQKLVQRSILEGVKVPAICGEKILITERRDAQGRTMFGEGDTVENLTIICPECDEMFELLFGRAA